MGIITAIQQLDNMQQAALGFMASQATGFGSFKFYYSFILFGSGLSSTMEPGAQPQVIMRVLQVPLPAKPSHCSRHILSLDVSKLSAFFLTCLFTDLWFS